MAANNKCLGNQVIGTAAGAGMSQARDSKDPCGQGAEGYFKRWGAGMAFATPATWLAHLPSLPWKIRATW